MLDVQNLQSKNVVPPAGLDAPQHVFDGVQPQAVVLQRTMGAGLEGNDLDEAALCRYNELHVVTGNSFINQWRPQYLSETFCFDFPRGTGGLSSMRMSDCEFQKHHSFLYPTTHRAFHVE